MNPKTAETASKAATPVFLGQIQSRPAPGKSHKRIAIVGLTALHRGDHPLKTALAESFERRKDWEVIHMSEAYLEAFKLLAKIPCDGVLARVITPEIADAARELPCPVVNISSLLESPGVQTVRRDDRSMGRLCARHLLEKGFTRIGMVQSPFQDWCFKEREAGFLEVLTEAGGCVTVSRHVDSVSLDRREFSQAVGATALARFRAWLRTLCPPFALFLVNDNHAPALMEGCRLEGLRIPQDAAVITPLGHPEILPQCHPSLTYAEEDHRAVVEEACKRLAELMRNPLLPLQIVTVPCSQLFPGSSTDVFAVDDALVARAIDFMDSGFRTGINVADVVKHIACARRLLERRFSAAMGKTTHQYLMELRLKAAREQIEAAPDAKLASVAESCGFRGYKSFRTAFHAATGQSPSQWCRTSGAKQERRTE